ncbi:MAG: hypothetical protein WB681_05675 [Candidatus Cybelea sp.]
MSNKGKTLGRKHSRERRDNIRTGQLRYYATDQRAPERIARARTAIEGWRDKLNVGIRHDAESGRTSEIRRRSGMTQAERSRRSELMHQMHHDPEIAQRLYRRTKYTFKSPETRANRIDNLRGRNSEASA